MVRLKCSGEVRVSIHRKTILGNLLRSKISEDAKIRSPQK